MGAPPIPDLPDEPGYRGVVLAGPSGEVPLADAVVAYGFLLPPSATQAPRHLRVRTGAEERTVRLEPSGLELAPPPMPRDDGDRVAAGSDELALGRWLPLPPGEHAVTVLVGPFASNEVLVRVAGDR